MEPFFVKQLSGIDKLLFHSLNQLHFSMKLPLLFFAPLIAFVSYGQSLKYWVQLDAYNQVDKIPFYLEIKNPDEIWIYNAQDSIKLLDIKNEHGKINAQFPVFNTELNFELGENLEVLIGNYIDNDKERIIKIFGKKVAHFDQRFDAMNTLEYIAPKWEFIFNAGEANERKGILELNLQGGNVLFASLLTASGDYRYLEGGFDGNKLMLSTLDGKFAYLIEAELDAKNTLRGRMHNPFSAEKPFIAIPNSRFELPDAYGLTTILTKDGPSKKFTDLDGHAYPMNKARYQGKVTLVQIGGTWCPNCLDESKLLSEWYRKYQDKGLEIVGLFFEISDQPKRSLPKIAKLQNDLDIPYTLLFAGNTQAENVKAALPMLEQLRAYPTLLIYDKNYRLIKVHTGFSGPSTSQYNSYVKEMELLIEELLAK